MKRPLIFKDKLFLKFLSFNLVWLFIFLVCILSKSLKSGRFENILAHSIYLVIFLLFSNFLILLVNKVQIKNLSENFNNIFFCFNLTFLVFFLKEWSHVFQSTANWACPALV